MPIVRSGRTTGRTFCPFGRDMVSEDVPFFAGLVFFPFLLSDRDFREASFGSVLLLILCTAWDPLSKSEKSRRSDQL